MKFIKKTILLLSHKLREQKKNIVSYIFNTQCTVYNNKKIIINKKICNSLLSQGSFLNTSDSN